MLVKYIDWDKAIIWMLRKHRDNEIALDNLREQYSELNQSLDGTAAIDYAKPRVVSSGGDPSNALVNQLLLKQTLEHKIAELEAEAMQYDNAWCALTTDERNILQEFFQMGRRPSQDAVDILCEVHGYERTKVYGMRRDALRRFKELFVG